jgi:transposase InsO family protein
LEQARQWVAGFEQWYNEQHRHSALKFVTPGQRHRGEDHKILRRRTALYAAAKASCPERWSGKCRNWSRPEVVNLNLQKSTQDRLLLKQDAA